MQCTWSLVIALYATAHSLDAFVIYLNTLCVGVDAVTRTINGVYSQSPNQKTPQLHPHKTRDTISMHSDSLRVSASAEVIGLKSVNPVIVMAMEYRGPFDFQTTDHCDALSPRAPAEQYVSPSFLPLIPSQSPPLHPVNGH